MTAPATLKPGTLVRGSSYLYILLKRLLCYYVYMYRCFENLRGFPFLRLFAIVIAVLFLASLPLSAEDSQQMESGIGHEEIILNLTDLPAEESAHYAFLYGFQAILEKKCDGAFLAFTEHDEYVGGFLTEGAPDDFCVRISPDTITVSEPISRDLAMAMYSMLGDRTSLSNLMARQEEFLVGVIMFRPEEGMVVTPLWYAESENRLTDAAIAQGLNPEELYSIMETRGYDKDSLVASVEKGTDPSVIALDAMKIKRDAAAEEEKSFSLGVKTKIIQAILIRGGIIFVILLLYLIISAVSGKRHKDEEEDEE